MYFWFCWLDFTSFLTTMSYHCGQIHWAVFLCKHLTACTPLAMVSDWYSDMSESIIGHNFLTIFGIFHPFKLLTTLLIMVTKIWYIKNYLFYLNSWIFKYRSIMGRARPFRHNTNEPEMHYFSINDPLLKGKFWNEKLAGVITNKSYMNQWKAILAN